MPLVTKSICTLQPKRILYGINISQAWKSLIGLKEIQGENEVDGRRKNFFPAGRRMKKLKQMVGKENEDAKKAI